MMQILIPKNLHVTNSGIISALKSTEKKIIILEYGSDSEAFSLAVNKVPDAIVCYLKQESDCINLCRKIKENDRTQNIPVFFLIESGTTKKHKKEAMMAGADAFLKVPFDEIDVELQLKSIVKIKAGDEALRYKNTISELEEKLQETQKQYRLIFDAANDFVIFHYFDEKKGAGKIVDINEVTVQTLGYSKEELLAMRPGELTSQTNKTFEVTERLAADGDFKFERRLVTKEGKHIPVEFQAKVVDFRGEKMVLSVGRDISEQKKAMQLLKESEERFQKLFISSPVPKSSWQYNGSKFILTDVNRASLKASDGKAGNLIGKTTEEIYGERKDIIERFYFCQSKRKNIVYETDYITQNSKLRRIIFSYTYVAEDLLMLHTEDITERKEAEKELRESEEKLRALISEMDQGLAVHEAIFNTEGKMVDYRFLYFNESFEKQTGLKQAETIGKTLKEVFPDTENYWLEKYEEVVKTGHVTHFENYSKVLERFYEVVAYRNQQNQFATIVSDITERRKNLKELNLHNARLKALAHILKFEGEDSSEIVKYALEQALKLSESKAGYIFSFDAKSEIFTLQTWFESVTEVRGIKDRKLEYAIEDMGCWSEAVKQRKPLIINNYSSQSSPKKGIPEGQTEFERFLSLPVITDGQVKAVIGVANKTEDYTDEDIKQISPLMDALWKVVEKKQYTEELLAAKEKAEESDRLKSAFLANMSHEIRTPMNGILGFTEILKREKLDNSEKDSFLEIIETSGKRMLNTIDELVDISKIEAGQIELSISEIEVNRVINKLHNSFLAETKQKGLTFTTVKPLEDTQAILKSDQDKLESIFTHFLKNAIQYTFHGSIEFGYRVEQRNLIFYVKDTGVGIPSGRENAIFDLFVQAENTLQRPFEGVGLGLSIAKAYAEMIGGKIGLKSEPGKGSEFYLNLPFEGDIEKVKARRETEKINTNNYKMLSELTILVAEDDEVGRLYLQQLLESKCKKVLYAKNGKEAVELYQEHKNIDLVLMDIKMPVMDGYSATIKIRAMDRNAVIIAQTAYALSGDREKAIAAGCDDYLTKPLDKETLLAAVEKHLK